MENQVFPQMNTLVKMQETTLLSEAEKSELCRAANADSVLKSLTALEFFHYARPNSIRDTDSALEQERQGWLGWARTITPHEGIPELFELGDIAHNIRLFVKERILGKDLSDLYYSDSAYLAENLKDIIDDTHPAHCLRDERIRIVINNAIADFSVHHSLARIDLLIKFFFHSELLKVSEEINDPQISGFVAAYIDLELLSVLLQQRKNEAFLSKSVLSKMADGSLLSHAGWLFRASPAEQDAFLQNTAYSTVWSTFVHRENWADFDGHVDNYLLSLCKRAKLEAFGLFPLFAFLYAKLLDIKNVRILFAAKLLDIGPEDIRGRLRDEYEL